MAAQESPVTSGSSLSGTTLSNLTQNSGYAVTCGIEVENWTRFPLTKPVVHIAGGQIQSPPVGLKRRLVVMWDAPYDFNIHSNWLALGFSKSGYTEDSGDSKWYDLMYNSKPNEGAGHNLDYKRRKFYSTVETIRISADGVNVEAVMGSSHLPVVKVVVKASDLEDCAPTIKAYIQSHAKDAEYQPTMSFISASLEKTCL